MAEGNGVKATLYLKFIGVLIITILGVMSFVFVSAVSRNDSDHEDIKIMIIDMSAVTNARIRSVENRMVEFMIKAPPEHSHKANGDVMKEFH